MEANASVGVPSLSGADHGLLGKFVEALSGLLPLLDSIKATIEETTGKMPKVSSQLSSVTKATETATVEILNTLDGMSQSVDQAEAGLAGLQKGLAGMGPLPAEAQAALASVATALARTKESSMNIAMALQVQDITSQQIAGVSHMIESVRLELVRILSHFGGVEPGVDAVLEHAAKPVHFDTDAQYDATGERQEQADLIIQQWTSNKHG